MKKIFLLLFALVIPTFTIAAAEDEVLTLSLDGEAAYYSGAAAQTFGTELYDELCGRIAAGFENIDEEINISDLRLAWSDNNISAIGNAWYDVITHNPKFFYISDLSISGRNNKIDVIKVTYSYSVREINERLLFVEEEAKKILAPVDDGMTDLEKALLVHDVVITNYEYDYDLEIRDIYGFFTEKKGVCQAYTLAYEYLMELLGIECETALSDSMNHIWNIVLLDGSWYHADLTFDDPNVNGAGDILGNCSHEYFLCSDSYMLGNEHYSWTSSVECASNLYDNALWKNYSTAFAYKEGEWYVAGNVDSQDLRRRGICRVDVNAGTAETVYSRTFSSAPSDWYTSRYSFNISVYGGYLLYNTDSAVYLLNTETWEAQQLPLEPSAYIHGIVVFGDELRYAVGKTRYDGNAVLTYSLAWLADEPRGFAIADLSVGGGVLTAKIELADGYTGAAEVYVAAYDEDGGLIFSQSFGAESSIAAEVPDAAKYAVFLWENMNPLCKSVSAK